MQAQPGFNKLCRWQIWQNKQWPGRRTKFQHKSSPAVCDADDNQLESQAQFSWGLSEIKPKTDAFCQISVENFHVSSHEAVPSSPITTCMNLVLLLCKRSLYWLRALPKFAASCRSLLLANNLLIPTSMGCNKQSMMTACNENRGAQTALIIVFLRTEFCRL